ncbi:serine hydrolase domain-containing protein [Marisediminicola sp. LYQ85]|uniref:serine hydrolase domain-containing protein n=1 Tax=Marisediminicola sp. LYQ85 TaxID=3391062 RepID=UPI0039831028
MTSDVHLAAPGATPPRAALPGARLPRATPTEHGVDPRGILSFLDVVDAAADVETHSVMLLRHGTVVAESWWAPYVADRVHLLYSLSKTFTSTALGFAVAEGLVDLDATVLSYFPELDADITDARNRATLVRHVAAMASGHSTETIDLAQKADPADIVRGFLLTPPEHDPGTVFAYNQPCTFTIAAIIQKLTGMTLTDYLRPRLFDPLGIGEVTWHTDTRGRQLGYSGVHATTETVARLGQLYLQRGEWNGVQLLPRGWVAEATAKHIDNAGSGAPDWERGYGFQFWVGQHGYRGDGAYGQFCVVLPEHDIVLAATGQSTDMQAVLTAVWTHLLPALSPDARVDDDAERAGRAALEHRLGVAALPVRDAQPVAPGTHVFTPGDRNEVSSITEVRVDVTSAPGTAAAKVFVHEGESVIHAEVGTGEWIVTDALAASGGVTSDGSTVVDLIFVETPHRMIIECSDGVFAARWQTPPLHTELTLAEMRSPGA